MNIVGRTQEIEELERLYNADNSEFVAVYGRRCVGKTYLIKKFSKTGLLFGTQDYRLTTETRNSCFVTNCKLFSIHCKIMGCEANHVQNHGLRHSAFWRNCLSKRIMVKNWWFS